MTGKIPQFHEHVLYNSYIGIFFIVISELMKDVIFVKSYTLFIFNVTDPNQSVKLHNAVTFEMLHFVIIFENVTSCCNIVCYNTM